MDRVDLGLQSRCPEAFRLPAAEEHHRMGLFTRDGRIDLDRGTRVATTSIGSGDTGVTGPLPALEGADRGVASVVIPPTRLGLAGL